jgi:Ca2+-binding RTX toxin-like protein
MAVFLLAVGCSTRTEPERAASGVAVTSQALTLSEAQALCSGYPGSNLIVGTDHDDILDGTNMADCIVAGKGNDTISGGNNGAVRE